MCNFFRFYGILIYNMKFKELLSVETCPKSFIIVTFVEIIVSCFDFYFRTRYTKKICSIQTLTLKDLIWLLVTRYKYFYDVSGLFNI
jgi:hypothetical protein